jgi:hypothetical protein
MTELDDLVSRLGDLYTVIGVKGKTYAGNNPYVLNKINNLLRAGKLKIEDIKLFVDSRIEICNPENPIEAYLYYSELEQVYEDICDEYREIRDAQRQ